MENFVKAPWRYETQSGEIYGGKSDVLICDMLPTGDKVHEANAALIAAAPEMYDELSEVVKGLELLIDNSAVNALYLPALHEQVERIEALRSKARGEK